MKRLLSVTALILVFSCTEKFETTHPRVESISEAVYASGVIKSQNQYQVFATVSGVIDGIRVKEGDVVKKGDVLLTIRGQSSLLNLENARLAAARAELSANADKLRQSRAAMNLARAKLTSDSLLWVRQKNLNSQGVGTQVDLEQRELAYRTSVTNYLASQTSFYDLERDLTFSSRQSKTNVAISESLAGEYSVRAVADGRVYKLLKENGEIATIQTPLAVLGAANQFLIEMNVDEYDIARIHPDQQVLFNMDSYKGQVFEAKVTEIEPLMNDQSRSFTVKAGLVTYPPTLYPNLTLEANIIIRSKTQAITIPRTYLVGDTAVRVGKHEFRNVKVGIMDYRKVEILDGLSESDLIYKTNP